MSVAPRRTQAERTAATRAALLDATIDCLVEHGYVDTTTNRVAERAGVSRGAQVHHFGTKAELVAEALSHLARRRIFELIGRMAELPPGREGVGAMLDLLWEAHSGDAFDATLELWVAARTDDDLRERMVEVEREVTAAMWQATVDVFGERALRRGFRDDVELALSTVRGVALLRIASGQDSPAVERRWRAARKRLLGVLAG